MSHGEHLCQIADLIARASLRHGARPSALPPDRRAQDRGGARTRSRSRGAGGVRPLHPGSARGRCVQPLDRGAGGRASGRGRAAPLRRRCRRPDAGLPPSAGRRPSARSGPHRRRRAQLAATPARPRGGRGSHRKPRSRRAPGTRDQRAGDKLPDPGAARAGARRRAALDSRRWPAFRSAVEAVAIESLCYRGRSALERAAAVRGALAAELAAASDLAAIRPLLQELLDLVPLALDES